MNPVRIDFIRHKILEAARDDGLEPDPARVLAGLDALDVGCGGGLLSEVCTPYIICPTVTSELQPNFTSPRVLRDLARIPWVLTPLRKILE